MHTPLPNAFYCAKSPIGFLARQAFSYFGSCPLGFSAQFGTCVPVLPLGKGEAMAFCRCTVLLQTKRLLLRRFTPADANWIWQRWAGDPIATRFVRWNPHPTAADTAALVKSWCFAYEEEPDYYNWAIVLSGTDEPIGSIGLSQPDGRPELGFILGQRWWGKGYAAEAALAVCHFLHTKAGISVIYARHAAENTACGRALEKAGFSYYHTEDCYSFDHTRPFHCRVMVHKAENKENYGTGI